MNTRAQHIHALLFAEGGPLSFSRLEKVLACSTEELKSSLTELHDALEGTGLALIIADSEASLVIAAPIRELVAADVEDEFTRDIGAAGLEVLAIVLYEGPSTRATIDYIRGVNSSSAVRNLLLRGLIERTGNPADGREYLYRATTDALAHLGVTSRENVPEYAIISRELATFKAGSHGTTAEFGNH